MTESGFDQSTLDRLHAAMQSAADRGEVAGLVTALQRDGAPVIDAIGYRDLAEGLPMEVDTIFRIASMTKAVTAVAALQLRDEARFALDDPIARWLPELAEPWVLRSPDGPLNETVPAGRLEDQGGRIDAAHLQRIETGGILRPTANTLEAILTIGLGAPYRIRRDVLDAFGYRLPWALPTDREIEEGRGLCAQELRSATWPAYLMDHGQRVWAWNRYVPRLLGLPPDDSSPARFVGLTVLDLVFNPAVGTNLMIANADRFRPLFLRMFKIQTQPHAHKTWFHELLARARIWPGFEELWSCLPEDADEVLATQSIIPIEFDVPGVDRPLRFRIALIYLTLDPRFQVVHWIPYGAYTLRHCAQWAEDEGEW